jgi:hypothetical protein
MCRGDDAPSIVNFVVPTSITFRFSRRIIWKRKMYRLDKNYRSTKRTFVEAPIRLSIRNKTKAWQGVGLWTANDFFTDPIKKYTAASPMVKKVAGNQWNLWPKIAQPDAQWAVCYFVSYQCTDKVLEDVTKARYSVSCCKLSFYQRKNHVYYYLEFSH